MPTLRMRARMKLREIKVYTSKSSGKLFTRHDVTIPAQAIAELEWKAGVELSWETDGESLVLRPAKKSRKTIR